MSGRATVAWGAAALALLAASAWPWTPRLVFNASDSLPRGWYRVAPGCVPRVGRVVLVRLPASAAAWAAQRGYLPLGVPLLKPVAAVAGQHVCRVGDVLRVDGGPSVVVRPVDGRGRPLPSWRQCRVLRGGELLVLGTAHPASFDSRYVGPVDVSAVLGCASPLGAASAVGPAVGPVHVGRPDGGDRWRRVGAGGDAGPRVVAGADPW